MTATAAEALELALWLHRAPQRRAALLGRPLPAGIGQLLRVAAGARDQVAAAALITGEPEAEILEAVRFYIQQVLFHEEADAWRVLGLNPGATEAKAREHHRLLQHWLHPDRRGPDDWDAIYATRVNRAWTEIRTGKADAGRSRYSGDAVAVGGSRFSGDFPVPVPRRSKSKIATVVVLLACIGLLVAIALRNDQPPEWRDPRTLLATEPAAPPTTTVANSEVVAGATLVAALDAIAAEAATRVAAVVQPDPPPAGATSAAPVGATSVATSPIVRPRRPVAAEAAPTLVSAPTATPAAPPAAAPPAAPAATPEPEAARLAAAAPVRTRPPAAPVAAPAIPDALARRTPARQRADLLTAYLGDLGKPAPAVWNTLDAFRQAEALRAALHQRLGDRSKVPLQLQDPQWRLASDGARLASGYRAAGESGRLAIEFTWREDQLLVRAITLEPDA